MGDAYNQKLKEIERLNANISRGMDIIANREQKVFTLEAAVTSLKDIVQDNNVKISGLSKEIDQMKLELSEKDKFIQAQREKLTQASKSIKDLQVLLGDAGKTIDKKNSEIEDLTSTVETFKFDKKNLLGIVQQLATIGNPGINLKSLMDNDVLPASPKQGKASFRLVAQESQRSFRVHKDKIAKSKKINLAESPKKSQTHKRSFSPLSEPFRQTVNSIEKESVGGQEASELVTDNHYVTRSMLDDKPPSVSDENRQTVAKEVIPTPTTVTSFLADFPSVIGIVQKATTALPIFFTTPSSKPAPSSPSPTASRSQPVPVS